jgi:DNA-binding MurR/RpiR family transcriptional regulator
LTENTNEALLLNATQIAKKAKVSEATLTRFIAAFSFSGYAAFKKEIGKQILNENSMTARLAKSAKMLGDRGSLFAEIMKGDISNIHSLRAAITDKQFDQAVTKIFTARNLYVLGLRTSFSCAFYLSFSLQLFLNNVKLISPNIGDIPERFIKANNKDVMVSICFRRYTHHTIKIAEQAKQKGVFILAITNSMLSPIAHLADMVLTVETDIPTFTQSYTAPICLLTALITAVSLRDKKATLNALDELDQNHKIFETYYEN